MTRPHGGDLRFREGGAADLKRTFALSEAAMHDAARRQGIVTEPAALDDGEIRRRWL